MSHHSGHFRSFSGIGEVSQPVVFRKDWLETCIRVNSDELSALADNYEPFEDGKEFTNPATGILLTWTCSEGTLCFRP